jgi:acyl-CoA synthetase (AMP-forming)/AMP-acid ligase II
MSSNVQRISEAIIAAGNRNPGGCAFLLESREEISFEVLNAQIAKITQTLRAMEVKSGSRIAFASPRNYLGIVGFVGIADAGICCPVNPRLSEQEFVNFFLTLSISVLVTAADATEAIRAANKVNISVVTLEAVGNEVVLKPSANVHHQSAEANFDQQHHALLMQTSGTTSQPKIVLLTHENILASAGGIAQEFIFGPHDLCLNPMPLHHVHGLISAGISSLLGASATICLPSFSPRLFASIYDQFQPTWFTGSPAMHIALLEHYRRSSTAPTNSRLRFLRSSSAPLPAVVISDLEQLFRAPLIETYGLTETASMITTNPLPPGIRKVGSVGKPNIGELRVLTDKGQLAPANVEGEIIVRGPSVISRYAEIGDANDEYFAEGWLRTGDLGKLDEDGYCFITGRKKELIKRGGLSVYPNEIDNVLTGDPRVSEAVTFSIPHPTLGEEVVAAVVPVSGASLNGDELREMMLEAMPAYKVPAKILILKDIPKSETGKILRRSMAERLGDLLQPKNEAPNDPWERKLLAVWRDVLSRDDIGTTDNLFVFGADPSRSRLAEELLIEAGGSPDLSASDMFRAPTVSQQATILRSRIESPLAER